jgi:internalin A
MKNTYRIIALFSLPTFFLSVVPAKSNPNIITKSFTQWCLQKDTTPAETRRTIEVLLKKAGTTDCKKADHNLSAMRRIDLYDSQISDLKPLAGFHDLTWLILSNNQISDLQPLSTLTSLSHLFLSNNKIVDIKPLSNLGLSILYLNNNPVSGSSHHLDIPPYITPPVPQEDPADRAGGSFNADKYGGDHGHGNH